MYVYFLKKKKYIYIYDFNVQKYKVVLSLIKMRTLSIRSEDVDFHVLEEDVVNIMN